MNPPADNPAARLRAVLQALVDQPQQITLRRAWGHILGAEDDDTTSLIVGIAEVSHLIEQLEVLVSLRDGGSPLTTRWAQPVRDAVRSSIELDLPASTATHYLTEVVFLSLAACEELVPGVDLVPLDNQQVKQAIVLIDQLLEALTQANLDPSAHDLLIRQILAIQHALKLYPVVGDAGLYDALLSTISALGIYVPHAEQKRPWFARIKGALAVIADLVTVSPAVTSGAGDLLAILPQ